MPGADVKLCREVEQRLREAVELLGLWLNPMKLPCSAPAHQGDILSCTCRNVEIERRTREFLTGRIR